MERRLAQAAATMVCVCLAIAEGGATGERNTVRRIGPGSIAAGRAHTVMAMPDGRVFAWGAGERGQIGDGALVDRWSPTLVPGVTDIVSVAAGDAHTVAVTDAGEVYAWGANSFGRLGDGTRKRRPRPVRVKGLSNIRKVAAGRAHTLALTADGRVYAWGRNLEGQLGLGTRISSAVPVEVRGLQHVVSIAAGDSHSLAASSDGHLYAWGDNEASQIGDGTAKDRLRPVLLTVNDIAAVAAGGAHSLALTKTGSVYAWGRGAQGQLGSGTTRSSSTPKLVAALQGTSIAAGRNFSAAILSDGRLVEWGANGSGQLGDGTLLRRLRPTTVVKIDRVVNVALGAAHSVAVSAAGDVASWGDGASGRLGSGSIADATSPVEIISDVPGWGPDGDLPPEPPDTTPPTITATTAPPLTGGWMTTPVVVSFACADNVGVASCSGPVTVSTDGYGQQIVGSAIDAAGNKTSITVSVNLDLHPPVLTVTSPQADFRTDQRGVHIVVAANDVSGVSAARCNGQAAAHTNSEITCDVSITPGRNDVSIDAEDGTGHSAATSLVINGVGVATRIMLTPVARKMEVNDVGRFSLVDEFGARVEGATWSSSDPSIVALSDADPPEVAALAVGEATITAQKDGIIAEASVGVSAELAPGDTRWSIPATPDYAAEPPLFTHRVDPSVPHMFTVETQNWGEALLRAVTDEGEVLWQQQSPGVPFMGDAFGGVIAGVLDASGSSFGSYARIGGGIAQPWRFVSAGTLERPAQATDGTLYGIEFLPGTITPDGQQSFDKYVVVIDGESGRLVSRTMLPREIDNFVSASDGLVLSTSPPIACRSVRYETAPETLGPVVGADGRGYFVVRRHHVESHADCQPPFRQRPDRSIAMGLDLYSFGRDGAPRIVDMFSTSCTAGAGTTLPCDLPVRADQLMPDAIDGTLVTWERGTEMIGNSVFVQKSMTRIDAESALAERFVSPAFSLEMIGQNGMALTYGDNGWETIDVTSGATQWSSLLPDLSVLATRPDGGIAALDVNTGELKSVNPTGDVESSQPFGLDWRAVHAFGGWIGLVGSQLTAVVGDFLDATRFAPFGGGNVQNQLAVRRPGMGITLKSQKAKPPLPIYHTAIKITPINQQWMQSWYAEHPLLTPRRDPFGNLFITLGGGLPNGQDTASNCFVPGLDVLVGDTNREGDIDKPAVKLTALPIAEREEANAIIRLLDWHDRYTDNALYACFPEDLTGFYNSNSYVRTLLEYARVPHDGRQPKAPSPGWLTIIPPVFFR